MNKTDGSTKRNSSLALERLRAIIDQNENGGQNQLPAERELAERIGVGRRAVRRALEVLEAEGRVWRRQGSGTFIGPASLQAAPQLEDLSQCTNLFEVMEVRLRIEPILAQMAALRATPGDTDRLRALADKIAAASDLDSRELWDSALHRAFAALAGNKLFLALFDVVNRIRQDETWRHAREAVRTSESLALYQVQHMAIIEAIERRDPVGAERAMRRHLLSLQENLTLQPLAGEHDHA